MSKRLWELDFLRGIAVLLMMLYHLVFDLHFFYQANISPYDSFWYYQGRLSAILFIFLVGTTSAVLYRRNGSNRNWHKTFKRSLRLLVLALIITLGSWWFEPSMTIYFGILHFLGISILLGSLFLGLGGLINLSIAILCFTVGNYLPHIATESWVGLPFGLFPSTFGTFDYFPLFPWFGVVLLGIAVGNWLYKDGTSPISLKKPTEFGFVGYLGRYSLLVYVIHQPIFLGLLWFFMR